MSTNHLTQFPKNFFLGFLIFFFGLNAFGQRKYRSSHEPKEVYLVYQKMNPNHFFAGKEGTNISWDFTEAEETDGEVSKWISKPDSTVREVFPEANLVERYEDGRIAGLKSEFGRTYLLGYLNPETGMKIEYPQPLLLYRFPMNYQDVVARKYTTTFNFGERFFSGEGDLKMKADAYGSLQMPDLLFRNVIRVKVTRDQTNYIEKYETSQKSLTTIYMWFDADNPYPVLILQKTQVDDKTEKEVLYRKKLSIKDHKNIHQQTFDDEEDLD